MKKNLSVSLLDLDGKPLKKPKQFNIDGAVTELQKAVESADMNAVKVYADILQGKIATEELTASHVCLSAMLSSYPEDKNLSGDNKLEFMNIVNKIHDHPKEAELSPKEVTLILDRVNKSAYGTVLVYSQIYNIFNAESTPVSQSPIKEKTDAPTE